MRSSTSCGKEFSRTYGCAARACISFASASNENGCGLPSCSPAAANAFGESPSADRAIEALAAASTERRSIMFGREALGFLGFAEPSKDSARALRPKSVQALLIRAARASLTKPISDRTHFDASPRGHADRTGRV